MRRALTALAVTAALSLIASPALAKPADTRLLGRVSATVADGVVSTTVAFRCPAGQDYQVYVNAEQIFGTLPDGQLDAAVGNNLDDNAESTLTTGTCTGRRQTAVATVQDNFTPFRAGTATFIVQVGSFVGDERTSSDELTRSLTIR